MRDNWEVDKIENICDILDNMRIPLNSEQRDRIPGNIPYYGANGIQGYIGKYIFNEDLILLAEDGGNFEEYSTRPIAYQIKGKSWVNNHAHILKVKKENNQNFIFYSLVNKNIIPFIKGGTRSKLNLSDLKCVEINLPPLPQQQKIAKILTTCDAVIEKTEAAIAKYQAMKQGLMHDLFTRGIDTNTGKLRPKYEDAKHLYKQSELGWIPKEWEVKKLEEFLILKSGEGITSKDIYSFKEYPVYGGNGLRGYTDTYTHQGDYVLIGRQGALCGNITLADKKFYASEHAVVVTIMNDSHVKWVEYKLRLMNLNQYSEASAQPGLSVNKINRLYIKVPNGNEQNLIARKFIVLENKINTEQSALSKYQKLKTGLMQDLLSGNVEVKI